MMIFNPNSRLPNGHPTPRLFLGGFTWSLRGKFRKCTFFATLALLSIAWPAPLLAQLTATVTPGYTFAPGEFPTTATMNMLGQPSIFISGTISGTVGLAAKTVTGVHLADSVVDNITLDFNGSSPRAIEIKTGGVSTAQIGAGQVTGNNIGSATIISTNIAAGGIHGTNLGSATITSTNIGAGQINGTNVGSATITSTNIGPGQVYGTNIDNASIGAGLQKVANVISATTTIAGSSTAAIPGASSVTAVTVTHGLPSVPGFLRVALVCQSADGVFNADDELSGEGFYRFNAGTGSFSLGPMFSAWADATTANVAYNNTGADAFLHWQGQTLVPAKWKIKLYYAR